MSSKKVLITLAGISLILSISFYIYLFQRELQTPKHLSFFGMAPDFVLTDSNGDEFSSQKLQGKVWVADFIFTTCGNICPIMTQNMAQLYRSYKLMNDVSWVSISVNPETDTPEVLQNYAKKFDANPKQWHFLTGTRDNITDITVKGFKMGSVDEPVFHSGKFVLVDRHMRVRGYYEGTEDADITKLFKDLAKLLQERE